MEGLEIDTAGQLRDVDAVLAPTTPIPARPLAEAEAEHGAFVARYEKPARDGTPVNIATDMTELTYDILAETLFSGQWDNGMVPHILFHKVDPSYFPGPDVWGGVEDKSQLKGLGNTLRFGLRWLFSYPSLVWRFLRQPLIRS